MYLVATDSAGEILQSFSIESSNRVHIKTVSMWLLLNDAIPSGQVKLSIKNSDGSVIYTETKLVSDIKTFIGATQSYSHGKFVIEPTTAVRLGRGDYFLCLEHVGGYSFTQFVAWCRDWESPYFPAEGSAGDYEDPHYLRIYDHKGREVAR